MIRKEVCATAVQTSCRNMKIAALIRERQNFCVLRSSPLPRTLWSRRKSSSDSALVEARRVSSRARRARSGAALTPHCGVIHSRARFNSPRSFIWRKKAQAMPVLFYVVEARGVETPSRCDLLVFFRGCVTHRFENLHSQILEGHDSYSP